MSVKDYPAQAGRHGYVVLKAMDTKSPDKMKVDHANYVIIRDCPFCGMDARVVVPAQGLWDWEHGTHAQTAFPDLSDSDREIVMTGIHGDCWDAVVPDDDDEDHWSESPDIESGDR